MAYPGTSTRISQGQGRPLLAVREILLHNPGEQAKLAQGNLVDWFFKEFPDGAGVAQSPEDLGLLTDKPIIAEFQQIVAELSRARLSFQHAFTLECWHSRLVAQ